MSSFKSILSSPASENRWVAEMSNTFHIDFGTPQNFPQELVLGSTPCVLRVPKSLSETKPEAYAPQLAGLGPYHHLRPDLYTMQWKKTAAIMEFLNAEQLQNFRLVVENLLQREYQIRASYEDFLDIDPLALAWIVAIDAVYLLQFLSKYRREGSRQAEATNNPEMGKLVGDILMLENQIPATFLIKAPEILKLSPAEKSYVIVKFSPAEESPPSENISHFSPAEGSHPNESISHFSPAEESHPNENISHISYQAKEISDFLTQVSPLKLNIREISSAVEKRQGHLLSIMYHSIVCDQEVWKIHPYHQIKVLSAAAGGAAWLVVFARIASMARSLVKMVPWNEILDLIKSFDPDNKESTLVEKIRIPSVSQLTKIARIKFARTKKGIRGVHFDEGEKTFYLPAITLRSNSEVILRNLMAYEAASVKPGSILELAEYVDLMCGIVDAPKDVAILCDKKIIKRNLTYAEIATIFNGIRKSTGDGDEDTTNIGKAIDEVNKLYANIPRVKVCRFIKKQIRFVKERILSLKKFIIVLAVMVGFALFVVWVFYEIHGSADRVKKNNPSSGFNPFYQVGTLRK